MPHQPQGVHAVAVVGASSAVGAAVVAALTRSPGIRRVVAVHDTGDGAGVATTSAATPIPALQAAAVPRHVHSRAVDTASPQVLLALDGVDAVVHIALDTDLALALTRDPARRRARALAGAQAVTTAAAAAGARNLVVVSSAMVYGASFDAPDLLDDDAPLLAVPDDGLVGDLLVVEDVLARARTAHPGTRVAVLRPVTPVGEGVDTVTTRHFAAPRLLTARERAPRWQFTSLEDLASAVLVVLARDLAGVFGVGSEGAMAQEEVEAASGMRRVELSARQARATAERLARRGVLMTPASDLAHVVHPQVVSSEGLRAAGWVPAHTNAECLGLLLRQQHGSPAAGGPDSPGRGSGFGVGGVASAGAAGAAVALVATAALLRQARSRRRQRP